MKHVPAFVLLALLAAAPARAEEVRSDRLASFAAGILCAPDPTGVREAPDTVSGTTNVVDGPPDYVSSGRIVPAALGVGFGVTASVTGEATIPVTIRITHPPFPGFGATEQSFESVIGPLGDPGFQFYQFDYEYELVTGDWVLEAYDGADLLWRTEWTVVPAAALPELASICGYTELLS